MANTTNFGWSTPDNSGLVKDGASDIRTLGSAVDTSMADLLGGTTGQVLTKASETGMDFEWTTPGGASPATPTAEGTVYGKTTDTTTGEGQTWLGSNSGSLGYYSTAIGANANAAGDSVTIVGAGASASGISATIIGQAASGGFFDNAIVIGADAVAPDSDSVTLGNSSITSLRVPGIGLNTSDGTTGQALVKTGANTVGWATVGGGGGSPATPTTEGTVYGKTTTSTYKNTALGLTAGQSFSSAAENVAIGYGALSGAAGSGQSGNTVVGSEALKSSSIGYSNTAIGHQAGKNQGGDENVFVGSYSGATGSFKNSSGSVGIGLQALGSGGGGNNVAVGYSALYADTTGTNNTAVGYRAGWTGTNDLTTGSNNTLIGYQAEASAADVTGEITLGNTSVTRLRVPGVGLDTSGGTTGQALVKTGANTVGWATVGGGGGGGMTVLATGNITSNNFELTGFSADYKDIRVVLKDVRSASETTFTPYVIPAIYPGNAVPISQVNTLVVSNGGTTETGSFYSADFNRLMCSLRPSNSQAFSVSNNFYLSNLVINIYNNNAAGYSKLWDSYFQGWNAAGQAEFIHCAGSLSTFDRTIADRVGGLGFQLNSGGSLQGTYTVYGIN